MKAADEVAVVTYLNAGGRVGDTLRGVSIRSSTPQYGG